MYAPPTDLDERQLVETLQIRWDLVVSSISYEPVGFGTHHYLVRESEGSRWFVNVDDLTGDGAPPEVALDTFSRAFSTARALADIGLEFVVAAIPARRGEIVVRLDERYAITVVPYVEGTSNDFGEFPSDDERRLVLAALGRLHAASGRVPADLPRRESFEIPLRSRLFDALEDLESSWETGPYGESCRRAVAEAALPLRAKFERYDMLVAEAPTNDWVITHGEPHAANVMRGRDGALFLIDWDTAARAPRERDLWMIEPGSEEDWAAYVSCGGAPDLAPRMIELYRLAWELTEIAVYTDTFRRTHVEDANTRLAWSGLEEYLSAMR